MGILAWIFGDKADDFLAVCPKCEYRFPINLDCVNISFDESYYGHTDTDMECPKCHYTKSIHVHPVKDAEQAKADECREAERQAEIARRRAGMTAEEIATLDARAEQRSRFVPSPETYDRWIVRDGEVVAVRFVHGVSKDTCLVAVKNETIDPMGVSAAFVVNTSDLFTQERYAKEAAEAMKGA